MSNGPMKIGMKPPHPGDFIQTEILEELGLSIAKAAEILDIGGDAVRPGQQQGVSVA